MHFSTLIFVTSTMAQAAFAVEAATIPGYDIVPLSWQIEVSPGQVEVLNGTVEEVIAQAVAINPAFKLPGRVPTPARAAKPRSLYRRAQVKFCNNFGSARVSAIAEGADRLHGLSGAPTLGPGPGQCSRVSCSYNSAIYWCNDVSAQLATNPTFRGTVGIDPYH